MAEGAAGMAEGAARMAEGAARMAEGVAGMACRVAGMAEGGVCRASLPYGPRVRVLLTLKKSLW